MSEKKSAVVVDYELLRMKSAGPEDEPDPNVAMIVRIGVVRAIVREHDALVAERDALRSLEPKWRGVGVRPVERGAYWFRNLDDLDFADTGGGRPMVVRVSDFRYDGTLCHSDLDDEEDASMPLTDEFFDNCEWAGPLTPPRQNTTSMGSTE